MIAVTICATRSYAYALVAQARKVQACLTNEPEGIVILVGDNSPELNKAKMFYEDVLKRGWTVVLLVGEFEDNLPNYKNAAQLIIARMRSIAFDRARKENVDLCWSLDSDVLPPPNALRCMKQMLEFDDRFYSVSTCPYPSQGGGGFLGGRGTPEHPILPDFYDDERVIPRELRKRMNASRTRLTVLHGKPDEEWRKEHESICEEVQKCPPTGNIFSLQAKGFRRRGWMEAAYPGIGLGAIVPSDWCGFGCTLMDRKALALAQFEGYDGGGTEDLYIVWKKWHRHGLKINVIPHAPCDHVIRNPRGDGAGQFILCQAFHERNDKECVGHLRIEERPWYQQTEGEVYVDLAQKSGESSG